MDAQQVIAILKEKASTQYLAGMQRFGINGINALGVKIPEVRNLAKLIKKDHQLALELWDTGLHEARILASMIDDPAQVTPKQIDTWVKDFNSWDVCDQVCGNLFDRTPYILDKAIEFSSHEEEFIKRAGFVLMAEYSMHNKKASDDVFIAFFPIMEREAWDSRNFVKKAVNWSLRQIGKRNPTLNTLAIAVANNILQQEHKAAKWIATDALKELKNYRKK